MEQKNLENCLVLALLFVACKSLYDSLYKNLEYFL